jgi:chromosome segregation ATPase
MTGEAPSSGNERRIEELLRANAELAAEIRSLALERVAAPRSTVAPAVRRVSRLTEERDSLAAELESAQSELARLEQHNQELGRQIHEQTLHIEGLSKEVLLLRSGAAGLLRRLRIRLLRQR